MPKSTPPVAIIVSTFPSFKVSVVCYCTAYKLLLELLPPHFISPSFDVRPFAWTVMSPLFFLFPFSDKPTSCQLSPTCLFFRGSVKGNLLGNV